MASDELRQAAERFRSLRAAGTPPVIDITMRRQGFEAAAPSVPSDVTLTATSAGGVPADWVVAPGAGASRRLLYLHGGGYTVGSRVSHRRLAADISRATGCVVLNLDYRLAPEATFPAAVEDAVAAYRWMRANGPGGAAEAAATFIAGDSAGGGLTLTTMLALRDAGDPLPNAAITLSAWTDLAGTGESLETRAAVDPVFTGGGEVIRQAGLIYAGGADPSTPLISPLYADLAGLPSLLMQAGDAEILLDDTLRLAGRARAHGVDVTLHVEPDAFHVYPFFAPDAPESKTALEQIGAFVRRHGGVGEAQVPAAADG
ncbi:MAG: alpha/beta hydrolase [Dehalococcoidia bacterium]